MSIRDDRREAAIEHMADHLLGEGMTGASLRLLAAAAGTSDRMLLYYFADKDELLAVTLQRVAVRLAGLLDATLPPGPPAGFAALLHALWEAMTSPALQPFMQLWLELAAGAARGQQPHRQVAGHIADGFLAWIASRLEVTEAHPAHSAAVLLAMLEGLAVLDAVGRRTIADTAAACLTDS